MALRMMWLKKIDVLSAAKLWALFCVLVVLIYGIIALVISLFFGAAMMSFIPRGVGTGDVMAAGGIAIFSLLIFLVIALIFAAIWGFISGAIFAFILNVALGWMGGLEMEMDHDIRPASEPAPLPDRPDWQRT